MIKTLNSKLLIQKMIGENQIYNNPPYVENSFFHADEPVQTLVQHMTTPTSMQTSMHTI